MHQLREHLFLGSFVGWQLCPQAGLTPGSPLPVPPRQLEATTLIRSCLLKVLVFCLRTRDGTKRVVTDHQWSQLCSRIMVALATSLAELTPANIEWMARSTAQIKRRLCNYLQIPWQRSSSPDISQISSYSKHPNEGFFFHMKKKKKVVTLEI